MIVLCFTNPATEEMYKAATKGKTTKADKKHHGYGIEIIRMAVERNNGRMQYLFENGKLILEISFEI